MFIFKFLFKTLFSLLFIVVLFGLALLGLGIWFSPYIVPKFLDDYVEQKTGFEMKTKTFEHKIFQGRFKLEEITLYNPPEYTERVFVQANQVGTKIEWGSLLKRDPLVVDEVVLDINNVTWVRNARNHVNLYDFAKPFTKKEGSAAPAAQPSAPPATRAMPDKKVSFLIKSFTLRLKSFSVKGFPKESDGLKTYDVNYNRTFTNITDLETLNKQISDDLSKFGIQVVADGILSSEPVQKLLKDANLTVTDKVQDFVEDASEKASKEIKKLNKKLKKLFD